MGDSGLGGSVNTDDQRKPCLNSNLRAASRPYFAGTGQSSSTKRGSRQSGIEGAASLYHVTALLGFIMFELCGETSGEVLLTAVWQPKSRLLHCKSGSGLGLPHCHLRIMARGDTG